MRLLTVQIAVLFLSPSVAECASTTAASPKGINVQPYAQVMVGGESTAFEEAVGNQGGSGSVENFVRLGIITTQTSPTIPEFVEAIHGGPSPGTTEPKGYLYVFGHARDNIAGTGGVGIECYSPMLCPQVG